jgi:hypothetical protein
MRKSSKTNATLNNAKISKTERNIKQGEHKQNKTQHIKQWGNKREQSAKLNNDKIKKTTLNRNTILAGNTKQKYGGSSAVKQC